MSTRKRGFQYTKPEARPFAPSAAKRSSVLALNSINHLQHFFVKQAAKAATPSPHAGAQLLPSFSESAEDEEDGLEALPPSPDPPRIQHRETPVERPLTLAQLRTACWSSIDQVCQLWKIVDHLKQRRPSSQVSTPDLSAVRSGMSSPDPMSLEDDQNADHFVVSLMQTTTEAIRAVQKLLLALPDTRISLERLSLSPSESPLMTRHQSQLGLSTAARPRTSLGLPPAPQRSTSLPKSKTEVEDGPTTLRKASLELLGMLRDMDQRFRITPDHSTDHETGNETKPIYRQVRLDDLEHEKEQVRRWIQLVDVVLFASLQNSSRSILVESPVDVTDDSRVRVLSPSGSESTTLMDESVLPDWARPTFHPNDTLRRCHALLAAQLPAAVIFRLIPPHTEDGSREEFLDSLADGQLLCIAFNGALAQSERPWGFIQTDAIHVIAPDLASRRQSSENPQKVGLTFRRTENLQLWAAALRLRYGILLGHAAALSRERATSKEALIDERAVEWNAKKIARREPKWEQMLEYAVESWMNAVVKEKREGV